MNHKFTLGAIAGMSSLALAIPFLSQVSNAASVGTVSSAATQAVAAQPATVTAQVSQSAAEQAALAAHPGTITEATRTDSHFGGYKVEVKGTDGNEYDVIIDSATGKVTDSWIDGQRGPQGHDVPEGADPADAQDPTVGL
ncbi:MAG: hypothetical protein JWM56_352 [Candidatus Peribacteria bacterium]|nr:hypothetical protein [Candidatus Peribacteria bacterium]